VARMALLLAGIPQQVPGTTVNRLCGSGMDAVAIGSRAIRIREASVVLAGGVESMSRAPLVLAKPDAAWARGQKLEDTTLGWRFVNPLMREQYGVDSMAETAENVAAEYGVARPDQDKFALRSQQRCAAAMSAGHFGAELAPATCSGGLTVERDEHPRADTTLAALERLKPVVRPGGTVTAGNASGINDGSAALLLASESAVTAHGLIPRARVVGCAAAGVAPRLMGMGPVPAIKKLLANTGLSLDQMDTIEINEAFAAQALAVMRELGLPDDARHVNPNGGAIALGHPLGASGARLIITALWHLQRTGGRYGLCAMCIGVGQGIAMVIERI
jgi:acetyl-CoA acyltransferase